MTQENVEWVSESDGRRCESVSVRGGMGGGGKRECSDAGKARESGDGAPSEGVRETSGGRATGTERRGATLSLIEMTSRWLRERERETERERMTCHLPSLHV